MLGRMSGLFDQNESDAAPVPARSLRRRRRRGLAIVLALLLILFGAAAAGFSYYRWCEGSSGAKQPVTLTVPRGASGGDVVSMLHSDGVIRCGLVSRIVLRTKGETFQAGTYHLTTNMGLNDALDALANGPAAPPSIRLTIPPGWTLTEIAARVQATLHLPASRFLAAADGAGFSLPPYLPAGTKSLEGYLFPNTYRFPEHGNTDASVITKLLDEFKREAAGLPWRNAAKLGVTDYQIVTIASMIEKETGYAPDRAKIAAVIYNRLKIGMALQIDATLLYDDPTPGDNTLSASDLLSNSRYNTRNHKGLPPTPIASPGLASLRAALEPANVNYLYYVKCGTKGHSAFAASNSEFVGLEARCLG
jgi:UPF0755 protein